MPGCPLETNDFQFFTALLISEETFQFQHFTTALEKKNVAGSIFSKRAQRIPYSVNSDKNGKKLTINSIVKYSKENDKVDSFINFDVAFSPDEAIQTRKPGGIQQNPDGMSSQEEVDSQPDRAVYSYWLGKRF